MRPVADAPSPESSEMPAGWQLGRISVGFHIDLVELARNGGDLLTPLLLAAVIDANLAPISQDPVQQLRYASSVPPDELRRPVSINALAESLALPFETVRRRLRLLHAEGRCIIGERGVIVPAAVLSSSEFQAVSQARYERLKQFYVDLREHTGLDAAIDGQAPREIITNPTLEQSPIELCARLVNAYALRQTEVLLRTIRDPYAVFILLNIARANIRHLSLAPAARDLAAQAQFRQAVRPAHIAERLSLPAETVRRRLRRLEDLGYLLRTEDGVLLSPDAMRAPLLQDLVQTAVRSTKRLFGDLQALGVLEHWQKHEALPPPRALLGPARDTADKQAGRP